jgi:anaerobic ribonucleoside-triphosphate reductase activating protein
MLIRLAGIDKGSVVDGPGLRIVIFAQGCPHNCAGCHNADTHNLKGGYATNVDAVFTEVAAIFERNKLIRGVTFSGGEPFGQSKEFALLAAKIKSLGLNLVTYTGYTWEELMAKGNKEPEIKALLAETDILIDGRYTEKERDLHLAYRGSRNQRIIDVKASLAAKEIIFWQDRRRQL